MGTGKACSGAPVLRFRCSGALVPVLGFASTTQIIVTQRPRRPGGRDWLDLISNRERGPLGQTLQDLTPGHPARRNGLTVPDDLGQRGVFMSTCISAAVSARLYTCGSSIAPWKLNVPG